LHPKLGFFTNFLSENKRKRVKLDFQKTIATSQATLPVSCAIAIVVWYLCHRHDFLHTDLLMGMGASVVAVYLLAELNNQNALIRVGSRIISSILALLLAIVFQLHTFQTGHIVLLLVLLSLFSFTSLYQNPSPVHSFLAYLFFSLATLAFPKLWLFVPIWWFSLFYMRGLTLRTFVASCLGLVVPYWFYFSALFCLDDYEAIQGFYHEMADFYWPSLSDVTVEKLVQIAYLLLLLSVGIVEVLLNQHKDKVRVRILYGVFMTHAFFVVLFLCLQPQYFYNLLPLLMVYAAILSGHFMALTSTKVSHILCLVLMGLALAVLALSYIAG